MWKRREYTETGELIFWRPAWLFDPELHDSFVRWKADFETKSYGIAALNELAKLKNLDPNNYDTFRELVLFACWCATEYPNQERKPHTLRFQTNKARKKLLEEPAQAAETLLNFVKNYPRLVDHGLATEMFAEGERQLNFEDLGRALIPLCSYLKTNLDHGFVYYGEPGRNYIACLSYGHTVGDNNLPENEAERGLLFELALRIRCWTRKDGGNRLDIGDRSIPDFGRPHYKTIAQLISAALDGRSILSVDTQRDEAERLRKLLVKYQVDHPDIKWVGWPIETAA